MPDPQGPFFSPEAMQVQVQSGRATELFGGEVPVGPVRFAGSWWAVMRTAPERGYVPVEDPRMVQMLDETARRLQANAGQPH